MEAFSTTGSSAQTDRKFPDFRKFSNPVTCDERTGCRFFHPVWTDDRLETANYTICYSHTIQFGPPVWPDSQCAVKLDRCSNLHRLSPECSSNVPRCPFRPHVTYVVTRTCNALHRSLTACQSVTSAAKKQVRRVLVPSHSAAQRRAELSSAKAPTVYLRLAIGYVLQRSCSCC